MQSLSVLEQLWMQSLPAVEPQCMQSLWVVEGLDAYVVAELLQ